MLKLNVLLVSTVSAANRFRRLFDLSLLAGICGCTCY